MVTRKRMTNSQKPQKTKTPNRKKKTPQHKTQQRKGTTKKKTTPLVYVGAHENVKPSLGEGGGSPPFFDQSRRDTKKGGAREHLAMSRGGERFARRNLVWGAEKKKKTLHLHGGVVCLCLDLKRKGGKNKRERHHDIPLGCFVVETPIEKKGVA